MLSMNAESTREERRRRRRNTEGIHGIMAEILRWREKIEKGRRQIAAELKKRGVDRAVIQETTGLSEEELDEL